ncbi:MAG: cation diffusion facilitator family transporter [Ginsengibacter sp.]
MIAAKENIRLQKIITVIAVVLFSVKLWAWYLTGSLAVLTDALESTVNIASGLLGLYSLYLSAKPKDADHPYGHGKVEFISAAIEGTLISVAGLAIIYKSAVSFFEPHQLQKLDFGIILLGITGIINYAAGFICEKTGKKNISLPLIAEGKHLKTDTYTTIGIFVGLILIYLTNKIWLDSVVACIFGFIIIFTGYKIIRTSVAGIMDEADLSLLNSLVESLNKNRQENWIDIHNLRFIKYGSTLHCDCHLTVPWYLNVSEAHEEVESFSKLIRNEFGEAVELFVHPDGCEEFSCKICYKKNCMVRKHDFEKKITWTIKNISNDSRHEIES